MRAGDLLVGEIFKEHVFLLSIGGMPRVLRLQPTPPGVRPILFDNKDIISIIRPKVSIIKSWDQFSQIWPSLAKWALAMNSTNWPLVLDN